MSIDANVRNGSGADATSKVCNGWKAEFLPITLLGMKVMLHFDEPWDFTEHLAGKWWRGYLGADGWVELDEPFHFRGFEHCRVHVQPRYFGADLAHLREGEQMFVNHSVETPEGDHGLIGSIRRISD